MPGVNLYQNFRLEEQFRRRQQNFKPNLNVQEDAPLYRVDSVISGAYVPPNETNELVMECYRPEDWQEVLHGNPDCP